MTARHAILEQYFEDFHSLNGEVQRKGSDLTNPSIALRKTAIS